MVDFLTNYKKYKIVLEVMATYVLIFLNYI